MERQSYALNGALRYVLSTYLAASASKLYESIGRRSRKIPLHTETVVNNDISLNVIVEGDGPSPVVLGLEAVRR